MGSSATNLKCTCLGILVGFWKLFLTRKSCLWQRLKNIPSVLSQYWQFLNSFPMALAQHKLADYEHCPKHQAYVGKRPVFFSFSLIVLSVGCLILCAMNFIFMKVFTQMLTSAIKIYNWLCNVRKIGNEMLLWVFIEFMEYGWWGLKCWNYLYIIRNRSCRINMCSAVSIT